MMRILLSFATPKIMSLVTLSAFAASAGAGAANGITRSVGRFVCVVGWPDEERGTIVKAFVVVKSGHGKGAALAAELQEHVKRSIAPYKYPRAIEFVDALPRTETGKLQRFKLKQTTGARP